VSAPRLEASPLIKGQPHVENNDPFKEIVNFVYVSRQEKVGSNDAYQRPARAPLQMSFSLPSAAISAAFSPDWPRSLYGSHLPLGRHSEGLLNGRLSNGIRVRAFPSFSHQA
jgi:hypothetical protein